MAQQFAKRFYKSKRWQRVRDYVYSRDNGLCQDCLKAGRITPGLEVHHLITLTASNIDDADIALNPDKLITLCYECHKKRHWHDRSALTAGYKFDADGNIIEDTPPPLTASGGTLWRP